MGLIPCPPGWREQVSTKWVLSVDLGQAQDYTAIAALEHRTARHIRSDGLVQPAGAITNVRHLQRLPLGLAYPTQIDAVRLLLARPPLCDGCEVVFDESGVGRPVADLANDVGLRPTRITITAGDTFSANRGGFYVAKSLLISTLDAALHSGSLKIAAELAEAGPLAEEMRSFRRLVTSSGRFAFSAREGAHDDLILSIAIGLWVCVRPKPPRALSGRQVGAQPKEKIIA